MAQSARLWYTGVIILHGRRETMMRILNFGSLNLDFTYTVPHFVRPGETLAAEKLEVFAGGKGLNQSTALCRAGAEVFHAGCVGPDGGGLLEQLRQDGADLRFVRTLPGVRTGHTIIQVDGAGQNCILVCGGANRRADAAMAQEVLDAFGPGDWLLLQNEISGLDSILRLAGEKGLHIAFNPSPISPEIRRLPLETVELFLVNEVEGAALGGSGSPEECLEGLRRRFPGARLVLTLGTDGACYSDGTRTLFQPAFSVQAVDSTAAGDTFTGYFLAALGEGLDGGDALRLAAAAAAISVTRMGASPSIPTRAETEAFLQSRQKEI